LRYAAVVEICGFPQAGRPRFHEKVVYVKHPNQKIRIFLKSIFLSKVFLLESKDDSPVLPIFTTLPSALYVSFYLELGALSGSLNRRCHLPVDFGFPRLAQSRSRRLIGLSKVLSSHFIQQTQSNKKAAGPVGNVEKPAFFRLFQVSV